MAAALKSAIIQPAGGKARHTATVCFMHGLGDTGHGWTFLGESLAARFPYVKFVFPHAPSIPITLNGGYKMPGWFDVRSLRAPLPGDPRGEEDEQGILSSVQKIHNIVDEEIKAGIDEKRIIVGGFSQGGALSYLVALTTERKLAGIVSLSSWLPLDHKAKELRKAGTENIRFFHGHGKSDQVVQFPWGEASYKLLKDQLNMPNIEFHSYPGLAHSANEQELEDISDFLAKVIPPVDTAKV